MAAFGMSSKISMLDIERAMRIQATINTPGWADIAALLDSQAQESREEVFHIMSASPEKLTGKAAIRLASRARALMDFKESISDELKVLEPPNPKGRRP